MNTCENCLHYKSVYSDAEPAGECRLNPPAQVVWATVYDDIETPMGWVHPVVYFDSCCSKFDKK